MNFRFSALAGLVALVALPAAAQTPAKSSAGHSDLQGNWTTDTLTPLERPAELAGKAAFSSDAEAAAWQKKRSQAISDNEQTLGHEQVFFEDGKEITRFDGVLRTALIIDPPDGKIPAYTPEAQARIAAQRKDAQLHPADGPENRSLSEQCLYWATAGPPMLSLGGYNSNYQFVQTPNYFMIMSEMIHDVRVIPLDGRKHLPSNIRLWQGDSVGHWEGSTLVVDTTNFTDRTRFRGADENLHIVERFRRLDANGILYRVTVDDPTTFVKPWTAELIMTKTGPLYEYACHEGNYALRDILAGARADEKAGRPVSTGGRGQLYAPPVRPAQ